VNKLEGDKTGGFGESRTSAQRKPTKTERERIIWTAITGPHKGATSGGPKTEETIDSSKGGGGKIWNLDTYETEDQRATGK